LNFAFQRDKRLLKTDEFSSVFNFKRSIVGKYLTVTYKPNHLQQARVGIVVAKKIFSTAVERNRIKRTLREIFRLHSLHFKKMDVIIRPKLQVRGVKYTDIRDDFLQAVERIRF
jgi:ribonuclease P protein component